MKPKQTLLTIFLVLTYSGFYILYLLLNEIILYIPLGLVAFLISLFIPNYIVIEIGERIYQGYLETGWRKSGKRIGLAEGALVFLAVLAIDAISREPIGELFTFLSVVVAGKALFHRISESKKEEKEAEWFVIGTFISLELRVTLSWWLLPNTTLFTLFLSFLRSYL